MFFQRALVLTSLIAGALCSPAKPTSTPSLSCTTLNFPAYASVVAVTLPANLTAKQLNSTATVSSLLVSATYTPVVTTLDIAARYCPPTVQNANRSKTLQLLTHGITYTKDYWTGQAPPNSYPGQERFSWVDYAASQGYPTLAFDRPCNGNSTHGTSNGICQMPENVAVVEDLVAAALNGSLPGIDTVFEKIIYVGHDFGSLVGSALLHHNPTDISTYILSSFSEQLVNGAGAALVFPDYEPAGTAAPRRFGSLAGDPQYSIATNRSGVEFLNWAGDFDPVLFDLYYATRGTTTVGETVTAGLGQRPVTAYTGQLFVLNGNLDYLACAPTGATGAPGQHGDCSAGASAAVASSFPNAANFSYFNVPGAGAALDLHQHAPQGYKAAHNWLASLGY